MQAAATEGATKTLDVVVEADLDTASRLQVSENTINGPIPLAEFEGPELAQLIGALKGPLPLEAVTECERQYILQFELPDKVEEFTYRCNDRTLSGRQDFWNGKEALAPEEFDRLLLRLLGQ